ncbi:MAG TPA: (2Fe-2S) ferredoxin domain-containing protein [Candidatus Faecivivens stercoravium]|uniref:(2Fe-2S) ferredoxin domain-containing protein n=1 Tax=Candidatus Faecivivens stercoravium TaxID=2840803 RepID=A0A9D1J4U4_9FIRM|nr:(2Fe-2S) ferredoxin domain-containing protein [Candidatus Faecivivens stercoravium]
MVIQICVGSSCHLKGSFGVIQVFQKLIENYHLQDQVQLKAAFCMGHCTEGVSTMFGDEFVGNVNPENAVEVFRQHVLESMGRADGE